MSGNVPEDETGQVADVYASVQALLHDAVHDGYDRAAIAEALLCGARDVLASDPDFQALFDRFTKLHLNPPVTGRDPARHSAMPVRSEPRR